jgi:RNA polymerase sigma-70 factor (ECF subfamily)
LSSPSDNLPRDDPADDEFVELLTRHQLRLRGYVFALISIASDADDVLQEACAALWKKRRQFDRSRDFLPWACGVALIEVLRYRRKKAADRLLFSEAVLNALSSDYLERADELERRRDLLPRCLAKLKERDRWLIETRYRAEASVAQIAAQMGCPLSTVYSSLARIRDRLHRCVNAALRQESTARFP